MVSDRSSLSALPFDILTLIIPRLDLFDLARLRLVSRSFYQTFTEDELCRFALTRLVPAAPEAQVSHPAASDFNKLISRSARWMKRQPTEVERVPVAKASSNPASIGWGVAGDLLIYQSVNASQLVIKDLSLRKADVCVNLGPLNQQFALEDETSPTMKWKVWIPKSSDKGDSFVYGQQTKPSKILVTSGFWSLPPSSEGGFDWRTRRVRSEPAPNDPTQAMAIVSIDDRDCGKVICHWSSTQEVSQFTVNSKYFAYVTKQKPHKYHTARFEDLSFIDNSLEIISDDISVYAFPKEKRISSIGADALGKHLFIGFGSFKHVVQIIDATNGASLKKIVLNAPSLDGFESLPSLQIEYEFLQPAEIADQSPFTSYAELVCRYSLPSSVAEDESKYLTMAKWTLTATSSSADTSIEDVEVHSFFFGGQSYSRNLDSKVDISSLSISEQDTCFTIASVYVPTPEKRMRPRYGGAYHQQRGFMPKEGWNAKVPAIVTTVYDIHGSAAIEVTSDSEKNPDAKTWLKPISSITLPSTSRSRSSSRSRPQSRSGHDTEIPTPTVHKSPVYVGCGWVVFSKDRSDQCNAKNLFGKLGAVKRTDELVVVRFD